MSSTAISGQGLTLKIGTTASAKTITAITKANPGVITSTAHGLTNGQVIGVSGVVGMTEINGLYGVVVNATTNTFSLAGINTTAFSTYTSGGSATPTQVQVGNLVSVPLPGGQKSELEVTNLDSTSKEFIAGLRDNGQATVNFHSDPSDIGQQVLRSSFAASGSIASNFVITFANGKTRSFNGFVMNFGEPQIGVDQVLTGAATIRVTGDIAYA